MDKGWVDWKLALSHSKILNFSYNWSSFACLLWKRPAFSEVKLLLCEDSTKHEGNFSNCPFFTSAGLGAEVSVRSARNTAPPQIPTTFNAVPYSPEHLIRNTTEAFTRSTTEHDSRHSRQTQHPSLQTTGMTETSWVPWTTRPFSSTTEEVRGEWVWGVVCNGLRKPAAWQDLLC